MATEKVGIYRKYHGVVPVNELGVPMPASEWPRLRPFRWAVRWFGSDGKRFSKSFESRKEAERYAETKQAEIRVGKGDRPRSVTLAEFVRMYLELRGDLGPSTKMEHKRTLRNLGEFLGAPMLVGKITSLDARRFLAWYREREYRGRKPATATVNKALRECRRIFREAVACSLIHDNPFQNNRESCPAAVAFRGQQIPTTDRSLAIDSVVRHDRAGLLLRAEAGRGAQFDVVRCRFRAKPSASRSKGCGAATSGVDTEG
jgi:hypothetical protein